MVLLDSNILIRWVEPTDPDHPLVEAALDWLTRSGTVFCYTSQNLSEFWNACTRPTNRKGFGLRPSEADRRARSFEARLQLLPYSIAVHQEWRKMLVDYGLCGVQVHDARLAAAMRVHGVKRILTFNTSDFARFPDLQAMHPGNIQAGPQP